MTQISADDLFYLIAQQIRASHRKQQKISKQVEEPQQQFNIAYELGYEEGLTIAAHLLQLLVDKQKNLLPTEKE